MGSFGIFFSIFETRNTRSKVSKVHSPSRLALKHLIEQSIAEEPVVTRGGYRIFEWVGAVRILSSARHF